MTSAAGASEGRGAIRVGAAVDVGSNSIHLLVAAIGRSRLVPLLDESVQLGYGSVVDRQGRLAPTARAAGVEVLRGYVERARALGADPIVLVATEPLRRAADRSRFQAEVRRATGMPLHVLTAEVEARLMLLGVTGGRRPSTPLLVLDIGGGSTQLVVAGPGMEPVVGVLATGSLRLGTAGIAHDPPSADELADLRAEALRLFTQMPAGVPARAVVAGGTGSNTNRLLGRARLTPLDGGALGRAMTLLGGRAGQDLAAASGLTERRIRQLPAGIALVEAAMRHYGLTRVTPSEASVREGAVRAALRVGAAWPEMLGPTPRD